MTEENQDSSKPRYPKERPFIDDVNPADRPYLPLRVINGDLHDQTISTTAQR